MENEEPAKLYSPPAIIAITVALYFGAQLLAGVLIAIVPLVNGWNASQTTDWLTNNVWGTFLFVALVETLTLWLLFIILKRHKVRFWNLGLNRPKIGQITYVLIGFVAYFVLYILGLLVSKALVPSLNLEQKQDLGFNTATHGIELLPVFVSLVILPPITEEIVARGFLFGGLRSKLTFARAAIITSILFAAAHLGGADDGLLWVAAIDTFILSIILCYLREKTGSLWPSIGVHMLKNGIAFIVLFNIVGYVR